VAGLTIFFAEVTARKEAEAALRQNRDVLTRVVTDLGLPGMDGYELLAAIRKTRPAGTCPAIAVSAYARLDDRSRALRQASRRMSRNRSSRPPSCLFCAALYWQTTDVANSAPILLPRRPARTASPARRRW
jgi:CheY-like chemotaxis protein